ncbi:MAG: ATP-binding protein [Bacteroidales bacterium]|jgi:PAS domain S-box-containing protein|nr:ATP-binding protein [Bacteroidales bacterium]
MNIQDKTKEELVSEWKKLEQENKSLKNLYNEISRLRTVEVSLIASEIRYRRLFESAKDGILILDSETGKIVDVNPFLINLLGFSYEQFIKKAIWEIGSFKDIIANHDKFLELQKRKYVRYHDLPLLTNYGHIIHVEFVSNVYESNNKNVIQCNIRDISSQIEIEKDLIKAKDKAEESDHLKSAFLANMSHEIRTPMNGILGFAELLRTPNLTGEEQQKYIQIIEKSGARMLNIINDIVSISKIESGLAEVNLTESNINDQIKYIYTFFKPEIDNKGIQFLYKTPLPFSKAIIKTDREKIFAILTNLVKNAIKYSEKGSIELGYHKKDKYLEFYVKDSGIGIDSTRQKAIFERFVQADVSDKHAFQGAGLGLSISKAYVEMLGGKLWVESQTGIGSTFYFTIPYTIELQEPVVNKNDTVNIKLKVRNLKILVVDEDETSDLLLSIMLTKISRKILHARSGLEAIELCRNNPDTDLILMDIKMPVMDGYEATRQIRQFNKDVIIIAQTAYGLAGDREKVIEAGCNEYLAKPIRKNEFMSLIQRYFVK